MRKGERTREFIIEKTSPIFNTKGYAGTSIGDISEVTGLSKGCLYTNFVNKDEIALAAFDHNLKMVTGIVKAEMDKLDSYRQKLLVYTKVYPNFLQHPFPDGGCPILNTATEADDTHPELRKKAADAMMAWKNNITKLIAKGIETGEFKPDANAERMAITMIAMMEGGIMMSKLLGKAGYLNGVMEEMAKLITEI